MSIGFNTCKCKVKYNRQPCLFINTTKKLKYFSITESKYVRVFSQSIRSVYANSQQVTCPWDIVRFSLFFFLSSILILHHKLYSQIHLWKYCEVCFPYLRSAFLCYQTFFLSYPMALVSVLKFSLFPFSSEFFSLKLVLTIYIRI